MNKKILALLIPLMLVPLVSFGYAHWTDSVTKKYKLRPGTVEIHIIQWHIDKCTSFDTNCNGEMWGDELDIMEVWDTHDPPEVIDLWIKADPIFPCWELEFKMLVHVKGRLGCEFETPKIVFKGPLAEDPCFEPIVDGIEYDWDNQEFPGIPYLEYYCRLYKHNDALYGAENDPATHPDGPPCYFKGHYDVDASGTEFLYKPCECIMVWQYIHLKQAVPGEYTNKELQELLSCHWLRIDFEIEARNWVLKEPWGSVGEEYPFEWEPYVDP